MVPNVFGRYYLMPRQTVEGNEKEELQDLQERLDSKIRVRSPDPAVSYPNCEAPDIIITL